MYLKNTVVERPKGTKLCPQGKTTYVYHVLSTTYDPVRKFNIDKRVSVGKLLDGSNTKMIPNDRFFTYYPDVLPEAGELPEQPEFSQTLHAGATVAELAIADKLGLTEILTTIYGARMAQEILGVVAYVLTDESAVFQHYPSFQRKHLSATTEIRSDSFVSSRLLHKEISDERIIEMLRLWNKKQCDTGKIFIGCDSTNFNTEAKGISFADFGKAKDDPTKPQVNLAVAMKQSDNTPLSYDLFPGSIIDLTECEQFVEQMSILGYKDIGLLFDRGYFTADNVAQLDDLGYSFMMMLREDQKFVRELIIDNSVLLKDSPENYLSGMDVFGITVQSKLCDKTRYFHIYYDEVKAGYSKRRFLDDISAQKEVLSSLQGTKLRKNATLASYKKWFDITIDKETNTLQSFNIKKDKVKNKVATAGFFVIMTSDPMSCEDALNTYRGRDNIEKFFRGIKSGMDFDSPGVHDDVSLTAKIHLMFIAGIIRNCFSNASIKIKKETGNKKAYTVPAMIEQLECIECTAYDDGVYRRRYAMTAKQKLIYDALGLEYGLIDSKIKHFNNTLSQGKKNV